MTFHTTNDGEVIACHSDAAECDAAISSDHFDTSKAAREAIEERLQLLANYDALFGDDEDDSMFKWTD